MKLASIVTAAMLFLCGEGLLAQNRDHRQQGRDRHDTVSVAIRIYDYASLGPDVLARAQDVAGRAFDAIGVEVRWAGTVRSFDIHHGVVDDPPRGELTMIVLDSRMARRMGLPATTLGAAVTAAPGGAVTAALGAAVTAALGAAVTNDALGGRVGYVVAERLRNVACEAGVSPADLMGMVMTHEIGHLLLPRGSHADTGIMRAAWSPRDLRSATQHGALDFTVAQASHIRSVLRR